MLVADSVTFQPNDITRSEDKLPPYKNAAMQERINRIGASLVPAYQRSLPDTDESKILFQFQLIDYKKLHDAWNLPSGVILVPYQIIERLQNDSQIATVLADNIAGALEKQEYRLLPAKHAMTAANWAADAGGLFVPGIGTAVSIATYVSNKSIQSDLLDQSGRVSLCLLHDAGYDISQAPITWWVLAAKPSKDITTTSIPPRAINLYRTIGTTWKNYPDPSSVPIITPSAPSATATTTSQ